MLKHREVSTYILLSFLSLLLLLFTQQSTFAEDTEGYNITIKVKGVADTACYLGYHYGHKIFVKDTFAFDSKGICTFKGDETLQGGIYLAIIPGKRYFEFLVDKDQNFTLITDTSSFVNKMQVFGSEENELFNQYQRFLDEQQGKIRQLKKKIAVHEEAEQLDSVPPLRKKIKELGSVINDYRLEAVKEHPETFLATIFTTMQDPKVPADVKESEKNKQFQTNYYHDHFWDNVDFSDIRLLRTPILYNKTKHYLERMTVQIPDSINAAAEFIIEKSKANEDIFKYILTYITHHYETSKIVGMDAVFVYLADKYYLSGQAKWLDEKRIEKLAERVRRLRPNLIGKTAPELLMLDYDGNKISLHGLDNNYTVVYFWDYKCGHCKKSVPKMLEIHAKYKEKGVDFFSICTRVEKKPWKEYMDEYKIEPWINVMDPFNKTNFRDLYDIHSTPTIFVLDENKKILIKRIGASQLDRVLKKYIAMDEAMKNKEQEKTETSSKSSEAKGQTTANETPKDTEEKTAEEAMKNAEGTEGKAADEAMKNGEGVE